MLIDTHAHVYGKELFPHLDDLIQKAREHKLTKILMPNVDASSIPWMMECHARYPEICLPMLGLHPSYVDDNYQSELKAVESKLNSGNWVAIGEVGIDLYHDTTYFNEQKIVFNRQIEWAYDKKLPLVIHSRNAFWECVACLDEQRKRGIESFGVFHCFNEGENEAMACFERGFKIGIGGTVTYKKNELLRGLIGKIGLENIVLETDSPYLTPEPFRGKCNQPHLIERVANKIADVLKVNVEEVEKITTSNAKTLFKIEE